MPDLIRNLEISCYPFKIGLVFQSCFDYSLSFHMNFRIRLFIILISAGFLQWKREREREKREREREKQWLDAPPIYAFISYFLYVP